MILFSYVNEVNKDKYQNNLRGEGIILHSTVRKRKKKKLFCNVHIYYISEYLCCHFLNLFGLQNMYLCT